MCACVCTCEDILYCSPREYTVYVTLVKMAPSGLAVYCFLSRQTTRGFCGCAVCGGVGSEDSRRVIYRDRSLIYKLYIKSTLQMRDDSRPERRIYIYIYL